MNVLSGAELKLSAPLGVGVTYYAEPRRVGLHTLSARTRCEASSGAVVQLINFSHEPVTLPTTTTLATMEPTYLLKMAPDAHVVVCAPTATTSATALTTTPTAGATAGAAST